MSVGHTATLRAESTAPAAVLGHPAEKTIQELLQEVASSEEPDKAPALAELLKRKDVREGTLEVLRSSEEPELLGSAVLVLGRLGKRSRKDLREILSPETWSLDQGQVLRGLGVIGAQGAWLAPEVLDLAERGVAELAQRLKDGRSGDIAQEMRTNNALLTLGYIGGNAKKPLALVEKLLVLKIDAQDEGGMECRMTATCTLWRFTGAKERVLELYRQGLESCAADSAIFGLGEMGEHAAALRSRLAELLAAPGSRSKEQIAEALDKIDGKKPVIGPKPVVK